MDDIDRVLARLANAPVPAGLDGLEERVLARIGALPSARSTEIGLGFVMAAALAIGMASTGLPTRAGAVANFVPLGGISPLAPSTLLAGAP